MVSDPYVYPGTDTLKNYMGIRDASHLSDVEAELTHLALVRITAKGIPGAYDLAHLCEFHRQIFSRIYPWAGRIRTVDIGKTGLFAHAPHIAPYLDDRFWELRMENYLRGLNRNDFVERLAHYLGEVNAVHPFREGNGRTQRAFFGQLARDAGWRVAWEHLDTDRNIAASIASLSGDNAELQAMLDELIVEARPPAPPS
jgi:cell filamentation protein